MAAVGGVATEVEKGVMGSVIGPRAKWGVSSQHFSHSTSMGVAIELDNIKTTVLDKKNEHRHFRSPNAIFAVCRCFSLVY